MPSSALDLWHRERGERLDRLLEAHDRVRGAEPGRRLLSDSMITRQINAALVLQLAAEFQGFARDLHDELANAVRREALAAGPGLEAIVTRALNERRQLDRGNATPGALNSDFKRFGIELWARMKSRDARTQGWQAELERLNRARNGIAHSDDRELRRLREEGIRVTLATARGWQRALDQLASCMDAVLAEHFEAGFGGRRPWRR